MDKANAAAQRKYLKEAFVSNLSGGPIIDINLITLASPAALLLWSALQSRHRFFARPAPQTLLVEFLLTCLVPLASITIYASSPLYLTLALLTPALALLLSPARPVKQNVRKPSSSVTTLSSGKAGTESASSSRENVLPPKPFLAHYRAAMIIMTSLAILAVDFRAFPRRLAKVETWGTSLMDLGVGSFVFSAGIVSARPVVRELHSKSPAQRTGFVTRLLGACRHALPLLVLGFVRLWSVKGLEYQEHVTEYGVHWNFFFTLAFLGPFAALMQELYAVVPNFGILGIGLAVLYQLLLHYTSLDAYILTAARTDLISKNREGIFSLIGYIGIFLAGEHVGMIVLPRGDLVAKDQPGTEARKSSDSKASEKSSWLTGSGQSPAWSSPPMQLLGLALRLSAAYYMLTDRRFFLGAQVSRRLANLPYVLWVAAFNSAQLAIFWAIDHYCFAPSKSAISDTAADHFDSRTSLIMRAVNRNGLAVFLLANLGTGLVNLTFDTLTAGLTATLAILTGYIGALAAIAVLLQRYNVTLKL